MDSVGISLSAASLNAIPLCHSSFIISISTLGYLLSGVLKSSLQFFLID